MIIANQNLDYTVQPNYQNCPFCFEGSVYGPVSNPRYRLDAIWTDCRITGVVQQITGALVKCPYCYSIFPCDVVASDEFREPKFRFRGIPSSDSDSNPYRIYERPSLADFLKYLDGAKGPIDFGESILDYAFVESLIHALNDIHRERWAIGDYSRNYPFDFEVKLLLEEYFDVTKFHQLTKLEKSLTDSYRAACETFGIQRMLLVGADFHRTMENFDNAQKFSSMFSRARQLATKEIPDNQLEPKERATRKYFGFDVSPFYSLGQRELDRINYTQSQLVKSGVSYPMIALRANIGEINFDV